MEFLASGIKTILLAGSVLFIIFAYFCDLWTDRNPKDPKNIFIGIIVSFFYVFRVVIISFLILLVISLFFNIW